MTHKSQREIEQSVEGPHETNNDTQFDEVHVITETERGSVDIETGELVEDAEVAAEFTY